MLLTDVFENFRDMSVNVYNLYPAYFLSVPGLAFQACLKKNRSEIRAFKRCRHVIND